MPGCWSAFNSGVFSSGVAALLLFLGNLILLLAYTGVTAGGHPYSGVDEHLDSGYIDIDKLRITWDWRQKAYPSFLAASLFLVMGLLFLVHAVWILKKVHRDYEGNAPRLMTSCFAIAAVLPSLEFLQNIGSTTVATAMYSLQLTPDQLISLEFAYLINGGSAIWVRAMLYIFSSIGFFIVTYLTFTEGKFNKFFGILSTLNGIDGIAVFALEILAFSAPGMRIAYVVLLLFWAGFGVPLWLITLAFGLRNKQRLEKNAASYKQTTEEELTEK